MLIQIPVCLCSLGGTSLQAKKAQLCVFSLSSSAQCVLSPPWFCHQNSSQAGMASLELQSFKEEFLDRVILV